MPKYDKFLKGLLTNKARREEACKITMNERCSAVLLNKLPSKEKDPGSFTIPCNIGQLHIDNALVDLGASISLIMPFNEDAGGGIQEEDFGSLPSSNKTNLRDQVKSISTTMEADSHSIRRIGSSQYAVSTGQNNTLLYKSKQTTVPFPSRLDNHYRKEEKGNYGPKFAEAYGASHINDTIPRKEKDPGRFEFTHVNFFPLLYVNVMSKKFHNSIMKDKMVYKGNNVVGTLMNVPIFVGTFSVVTDFAVLENMDAYRDEGNGDVIIGEPFLREVGIKER
ncbi:hypothetical protein Tco_1054743 [Tanacetum coccineum]|uniref:Uncharacterized protein n=1 Tax=Tanacetum coccineum TaxID=301880 RepID=A0ABQ5GXN2_9ASTR